MSRRYKRSSLFRRSVSDKAKKIQWTRLFLNAPVHPGPLAPPVCSTRSHPPGPTSVCPSVSSVFVFPLCPFVLKSTFCVCVCECSRSNFQCGVTHSLSPYNRDNTREREREQTCSFSLHLWLFNKFVFETVDCEIIFRRK